MKLRRLRVDQLRQFTQPAEIKDFDPGLNLFIGPNESGKSTLVRAIRAAFFERHKSSSVDDLRPWGDSGATPTVELEFEWQGERWQISKNFLKKKRCDLTVGGSAYSGEEAEDKLASLLGFEFPGRGASQKQHWGVPGLLWVEQGAGQQIQKPVEHAGQHLKAALGNSLGEVASSGGDELIEQIGRERAKLLTSTGRSTGEFAGATNDLENLKAQQSELASRIEQYRQQVDRLGHLREERARGEAEREWETYREDARAAEQKLAKVDAWQRDQKRDQRTLEEYRASIQTNLDLLRGFEQKKTDLEQRDEERKAAVQQLEKQKARKPVIEQAVQQARSNYESARSAVKQAREQEQWRMLTQELLQTNSELDGMSQSLDKAQEMSDILKGQRRQRQELKIDTEVHTRLEEVSRELERLTIKEESVATRLEYDLEKGQTVQLGDKHLTGEGEQILLEPEQIKISGVGTLRVVPGGEDVAALARTRRALIDEQERLQGQLGVASLEEANSRREQSRELEQQIRQNHTVLESLAPQGLDALAERKQLKQARKEELETEIQSLSEPDETSPSLARTETQLEAAETRLREAEAEEASLRSELMLAEQSLNTAEKEWQRLHNELHAPEIKDREQNAERQLLELRANLNQLEKVVENRQQQINESRPDILRQDIDRLTRSADAAEKAAELRRIEIERLQAILEEAGAEGLEEHSGDLAAKIEQAERRVHELERRAKALDLLHKRLTEHRLELTRQLQAPLQQHLNRYLQLLFPEASLTVDENLIPEVLIRPGLGGDERGRFDELSFGSREQMALISRLAYADLLQEAGKPTLLILDDALVHSDAHRLAQMKRVLFDASQRHQILLFSCHPENWKDLGVVPVEVMGLRNG